MNDVQFCIEYVKRIPRPAKRKSTIQMIGIVESKKKYDASDMFDDAAIENVNKDDIGQYVYKYIRDHQAVFLNS